MMQGFGSMPLPFFLTLIALASSWRADGKQDGRLGAFLPAPFWGQWQFGM